MPFIEGKRYSPYVKTAYPYLLNGLDDLRKPGLKMICHASPIERPVEVACLRSASRQ